MAHVMVQTDSNHVVLVDEKKVRPIGLESESAAQLLDKIGWAIRGGRAPHGGTRAMKKYVAAAAPPSVQQGIRTAKAQRRARLRGGGGFSP
jgi:hypothetical protein